jgi:hypothetical protein
VFTRAYEKVVSKQLEVLKPKAIIVLGKTADKVLGKYYRGKAPGYHVVPGTIGWSYITDAAKEAIDKIRQGIGSSQTTSGKTEPEKIQVKAPEEHAAEKTNDLGLKRTCGFSNLLEEHFKKIGDRNMVELAKGAINGALDLSDSIKIEANTQWIKLMMPGYFFGIGPMANGFNLAFRSRYIDLGNLSPYKSSRGEGEDWVYIRIKPDAKISVQDIIEIVKKVNKVPSDIKQTTGTEESE